MTQIRCLTSASILALRDNVAQRKASCMYILLVCRMGFCFRHVRNNLNLGVGDSMGKYQHYKQYDDRFSEGGESELSSLT